MSESLPPDDDLAHEEHRALGWAAIGAVAVILWLVRPIGVGILLGAFLAFMMQPLFMRLRVVIGMRWSALLTVLGSTLAMAACAGGLAWLLVARGAELANRVIGSFRPGGMADHGLAELGRFTERFGVSEAVLVTRARGLVSDVAASAAAIAQTLASTLGSTLLGLLFAMLSMHYILRNWESVSHRAEETFPLRPDYTAALFVEFRKVGRTTLLGAVGTALAQGVTATAGYAIAGVPEPAFFGALTTIASFVPGVGVLLVLVPLAVGLVLVDQPGHAIVVLIWGLVLVVGVCDYVVRPRLVRGETKVPALVTFAALFGGVEVLGLKGLIVGPVLMALAISVLRLYASETRKRRQRATPIADADDDDDDDDDPSRPA
jgi:predicted PurR-regulated permease PerM